jgi:hypothetical protein
VSTAVSDCRPVRLILARTVQRRQSSSGLLGRHPDRTAILREVGCLRLFFVRYFLKMLATLLSAMERRISPERRAVINDNTTLCALSYDGDVHAFDERSMIVKEINVRPPGALRNENCALVGPQDQIDDVWIGYGDLPNRTLTVKGGREALGEHHRLFRGTLNRKRSDLLRKARGGRKRKTSKNDRRAKRPRECRSQATPRPLLNDRHFLAGSAAQ